MSEFDILVLNYLLESYEYDIARGRMPSGKAGWRWWYRIPCPVSRKSDLNRLAIQIVQMEQSNLITRAESDILSQIRVNTTLLRYDDDGNIFYLFPGMEKQHEISDRQNA